MAAAERSHESEYRSHILHSTRYTRLAEAEQVSTAAPSAPKQVNPASRSAESQSTAMSGRAVGIMLSIFVFVAVCGLIFLSGYYRMAAETYHAAKLQNELKQAEALHQILLQQEAVAVTEASIGQKAVLLGMTPINEQTAVNAGEGVQQGNQVFASSAVR